MARAWQATSPAEHFFGEQLVVDSPLRADFFRHVPGILTGVGIIGTFVGLILGLLQFDVRDPEQLQTQLSLLVQTVGQAFFVSAAAIALAMLFTWISVVMANGARPGTPGDPARVAAQIVEPFQEITTDSKEVIFTLRATEECLVGSYQGLTLDLSVIEDGQTVRQLCGSGTLRVDAERGVARAR